MITVKDVENSEKKIPSFHNNDTWQRKAENLSHVKKLETFLIKFSLNYYWNNSFITIIFCNFFLKIGSSVKWLIIPAPALITTQFIYIELISILVALIVKNTNVSVKHHYSLLYTLARHHLCYSEKPVAWINFPSDPESKESRPTHREETQLMQSSLRGPVHFRHVASHAWHFVLLSWYCPDRHAAREWRWLRNE